MTLLFRSNYSILKFLSNIKKKKMHLLLLPKNRNNNSFMVALRIKKARLNRFLNDITKTKTMEVLRINNMQRVNFLEN
jgi:hypothetical protein